MLVLLGDAGMGKTVLLAEAARQARSAGLRVLQVAGRESERDLAFAGLHQLLRPVLDHVPGLPDRQAEALLGAFGLSAEPVPPDALLTGIAVLTLLSNLCEDRPLLVVADDAQWMDRGSLDTLAFAARRLEAEPLVLLLGARGNVPPAGFERDFPELRLEPLNIRDAGRLLDAQPHPPRGRAREQVLAQAAGNPMALIELSRIIAADPAAGRRWAAEPLPPTDRLAAIIAAQYGTLPRATRDALLLAAVADSPDLTAAAVPGLTADALAPAETAGLIRVDSSGPQFTHPLVRAAIYHAVPFAERAAAHLKIADSLRDQPDRYAWHLAAAALEPDEHVASLLEETAAQAQRRGGAAAAARALERAAELSPSERDQAPAAAGRRRARPVRRAGGLGPGAGHPGARGDRGPGAAHRRPAAHRLGADLVEPARRRARHAHLRRRGGIGPAAGHRLAGDRAGRHRRLPDRNRGRPPRGAGHPRPPAGTGAAGRRTGQPATPTSPRVWIRAATDPFGNRDEVIPRLHRMAGRTVDGHARLGAAAWLLDETELAVRLLRECPQPAARPRYARRQRRHVVCPAVGLHRQRTMGRGARRRPRGRRPAAAYRMETVAASADLATATVLAMRGDHDQVHPLVASALATIDAAAYRGFAARARHAAGIAALAEGSYLTGYAQLSQLFDADGAPLHHHVSYLGIADLAAAAVRAERRLEARALVERALAQVDPAPGPRLEQLAARARGLLAEPADAEPYLAKALSDPAGDAWPFERAQLQLDYGEWLRRQRRINDAKPVLAAALETFRRLGAVPWTRRAEAELRACGVTVVVAPTAPGALAGLTAQQREIVLLARPRPDQRRDRRPPLPVPPHRRLPPVPLLPQAGHSGPPPAPRPDRPGRHRAGGQAGGMI